MRRVCLLLCLMLTGLSAAAGEMPPGLEFAQQPGAVLPLQQSLMDETGRAVRLGEYFGRVPVVLVLGYFECRNLCSTLLDGVVESLARSDLPAAAYRFVAVSIDPRETAAAARRRTEAFRPLVADAHFLTGDAEATKRIAASAGFRYAWDEARGEYMHPAGFIVVAPDGRVSRYFSGVRFDPRDVRLALTEASAGRVGAVSDRLLLLCSHYDPATGRYTLAAMAAVRAACLLCALGLAGWVWRRGRPRGRRA
ncbi:MAG TPA: SCO family protein [Aromatoleum sp.]|uniref:SCO family protein n=1 Tax=Aromatoleum sp. TaxID=2307007 RepID=UPI002B4834EF|nr:SCO family protein [Aromatoleum sp.]HJV26912.1 SCO family protein [Aromatoleum sp.]